MTKYTSLVIDSFLTVDYNSPNFLKTLVAQGTTLKSDTKDDYMMYRRFLNRYYTVNQSKSICTVLSSNLLTFGEWVNVNCDKEIYKSAVVCEKTRIKIRRDIQILSRQIKECSKFDVMVESTCYFLSDLRSTGFDNNKKSSSLKDGHILIQLGMLLTKWTRGIASSVLFFKNSTHTICAKRLCETCGDHIIHDWIVRKQCHNQTKPWLYQTMQRRNDQMCMKTQFACLDKTCILEHYLCDGKYDCPDFSDENNCSENVSFIHGKCTPNFDCLNYCPPLLCECNNVNIQMNDKCIPFYEYSDTINLSDDIYLLRHTQPLYDRRYRHSIAKCSPSNNDTNYYPSVKLCIFDRDIYGMPLFCNSTEHLENCKLHECPSMFRCLSSYCIPLHNVCNGVVDCPNHEDEYSCKHLTCPGMLICRNDNICVHPHNICDGKIECLYSEDDEMCYMDICPPFCECLGQIVVCKHSSKTGSLPINIRALIIIGESNLFNQIHLGISIVFLKITDIDLTDTHMFRQIRQLRFLRMLTIMYCTFPQLLSNFLGTLNLLQILNINTNTVFNIQKNTFSGLNSLTHLNLSGMSIHEISPTAFHEMLSLTYLNISNNNLEKFVIDNLFNNNKQLHIDIRHNKLKHIQYMNKSFEVTLLADSKKCCCYFRNRHKCLPFVESSDEYCNLLLINKNKSIMVISIAGLIFILNSYVFTVQSRSKVNHSLLIRNLSFSNVMFGLYLSSLAVSHFIFQTTSI